MKWPKRVTIILTPDGRQHVFREGDADLWPKDARRVYVLLAPNRRPRKAKKKKAPGSQWKNVTREQMAKDESHE